MEVRVAVSCSSLHTVHNAIIEFVCVCVHLIRSGKQLRFGVSLIHARTCMSSPERALVAIMQLKVTDFSVVRLRTLNCLSHTSGNRADYYPQTALLRMLWPCISTKTIQERTTVSGKLSQANCPATVISCNQAELSAGGCLFNCTISSQGLISSFEVDREASRRGARTKVP